MSQDLTAMYDVQMMALNGLISQAENVSAPNFVTNNGSVATYVSSPSLGPAIVPDLVEQELANQRQQQGQQGHGHHDPHAFTDSYVHKTPIAATQLTAAQVAYAASASVTDTPQHVLDVRVTSVS